MSKKIKVPGSVKRYGRFDGYFSPGLQYYILARQASLLTLVNVVGVMFHHTVEYVLLACLALHHDINELKKISSSHDLTKIWKEYKSKYPVKGLGKFDKFIHENNQWEQVRFPKETSKNRALFSVMLIRNKEGMLKSELPNIEERYIACLEELDLFIKTILGSSKISTELVHQKLNRKKVSVLYSKENHHLIFDPEKPTPEGVSGLPFNQPEETS